MTSLLKDSYRRRITIVVGCALFSLVLLSGAFTTWHLVKNLERAAVEETTRHLAQLAGNAVVDLLIDDPDVQQRGLGAAMAIPGITYAALLTVEQSPIVALGEPTPPLAALHGATDLNKRAPAIAETTSAWHFAAPVVARSVASQFDVTTSTDNHLGYYYLVRAKDQTQALIKAIVIPIVLVSLALLLGFLLLLSRSIGKLTQPLASLADALDRAPGADQGATALRVDLDGPAEIQTISNVFNRLMARIDTHQSQLASEVQLRTEDARAARDAALSSARHKSEFTAMISHEMRAPLQAITQYVQHTLSRLEYIEDAALAEQACAYQRVVLTHAEELLTRIDQILTLARAESGELTLHLKTMAIDALVAHVERTVRPLAEHNGNTLTFEVSGLPRVRTDPDKLLQIALNLTTNANKFTHNGMISVRVDNRPTQLILKVQDTGIGIAPADLAQIWDPYKQIDMTDTRQYPGTGLGLAITKLFVDSLGGDVTVDSEPGVGTAFTVRLTRASEHPEITLTQEQMR